MADETSLVPVEPREGRLIPRDVLAAGSAKATALADFIEKQKLYANIQGRRYVKVEGWTCLARMNDVVPREMSNEAFPDGHYVAKVQLVRLSDGVVLTEASGECGGPDEPTWQSRPPYARRSMAATRATGKACRLAYSWTMSMAGYEPTPLEEMDGVAVQHDEPKPSEVACVPFGKNSGKPITQLDNRQLNWYMERAQKNVDDSNCRDPEAEQRWLDALRAEHERRRGDPEPEVVEPEEAPF